MIIDLRQIPAFIINCPDNPYRRQHITCQLHQLGMMYQFIDGIRCKPSFIGCALSHLKILSRLDLNPPFIILEDDCSITNYYHDVLDIPNKTSCIYLGISDRGVIPGVRYSTKRHTTLATQYNSSYLRTYNMLSSHAILYIDHEFISEARQRIVRSILDEIPFDIQYASMQKQFLALTPNYPFFFQDQCYGGQEPSTCNPLSPCSLPDI